MAIRLAIVGFGKIAQDQHVPALAADPRFELAAVATRAGDPQVGVPWFREAGDLFKALAGRLDAVAICTPPAARHAIARDALKAGLDVLLEKPPATTLGEIDDLARIAAASGQVLYAAWHSQHAAGVAGAAQALAEADISSLDIQWREDVRKWHPGQSWIWEPGGFGIFDTGINALSIATRILPVPLSVRAAVLRFPANRQAPIAASLTFAGEAMAGEMDWRLPEGEAWTIRIGTADGRTLDLLDGGARLRIDGVDQVTDQPAEYPGIYDRFAALVESRTSDVDREPLRIVADAFLIGRRETVEAFEE